MKNDKNCKCSINKNSEYVQLLLTMGWENNTIFKLYIQFNVHIMNVYQIHGAAIYLTHPHLCTSNERC